MLDVCDFRGAAKLPEFGVYGQVHVRYGKAKRGGGPQRRTVLTVFRWAAEVVEQSLTDVRPSFGCPDHPAMFVTERGTRISVSYINERFAEIHAEAHLPEQLAPHCLRHSYVTHLAEEGWAAKFIQDQVGHSHAATTAIYMPSAMTSRIVSCAPRSTSSSLDLAGRDEHRLRVAPADPDGRAGDVQSR